MRLCIDKRVPIAAAAKTAQACNPENRPGIQLPTQLGNFTADERFAAFLLTGKKWKTGQTITIAFIGGDPRVKTRVRQHAEVWLQFANLKFQWVDDPAQAMIRIAFDMNDGSWSYIGTDALTIKAPKPTMNYGWLEPDTAEDEYRRVVLHEFGHALGMPHEHNHPRQGIPWDKPAVYSYYMGPPNNWSRDDVDGNLFAVYSESNTSFSEFDPTSIMIYAIPNSLTLGDYQVAWTNELSATDKAFIGGQYPHPYVPPPPPPQPSLATITTSQLLARRPTKRVGVTKNGKRWCIAEPWA
jgi:hypothetical protein